MARQLKEIIKPFHLMSPSEKLALIRRIRANRNIIKPAVVKRKKKAATTKKKKEENNLRKLLSQMNPEDIQEFLKNMKESSDG